MSDFTLTAPTDDRIVGDQINSTPNTFTVTDQTITIKPGRPDPRSWLKEAEADIAKAKRDLEKDQAKIAELEARCSEHRIDIKVHEARAEGARRGIAALEPRQSRKAAK